MWGSSTRGTAFSDQDSGLIDVVKNPVRAVHVYYDSDRVRGIICEYKISGMGTIHGSAGNNLSPVNFALEDGESITAVLCWSGIRIDALQFVTSKGRVSDRIGGDGGNYQNAHGANSPVKKLLGFSGRSGADLDGLEPIWADV